MWNKRNKKSLRIQRKDFRERETGLEPAYAQGRIFDRALSKAEVTVSITVTSVTSDTKPFNA